MVAPNADGADDCSDHEVVAKDQHASMMCASMFVEFEIEATLIDDALMEKTGQFHLCRHSKSIDGRWNYGFRERIFAEPVGMKVKLRSSSHRRRPNIFSKVITDKCLQRPTGKDCLFCLKDCQMIFCKDADPPPLIDIDLFAPRSLMCEGASTTLQAAGGSPTLIPLFILSIFLTHDGNRVTRSSLQLSRTPRTTLQHSTVISASKEKDLTPS
ncbi:hypothetical protein NE237_020846 [Protea cynaroides]|uniref:Uncharacterized protein n=1 Tax=Protea cynaroides TaxID=273540 RepID=A0A9Q0H6Q6_9MAGN|nr:hypothetical protein NE237_020846 [Protea cynaroides]